VFYPPAAGNIHVDLLYHGKWPLYIYIYWSNGCPLSGESIYTWL